MIPFCKRFFLFCILYVYRREKNWSGENCKRNQKSVLFFRLCLSFILLSWLFSDCQFNNILQENTLVHLQSKYRRLRVHIQEGLIFVAKISNQRLPFSIWKVVNGQFTISFLLFLLPFDLCSILNSCLVPINKAFQESNKKSETLLV